MRRQVGKTKPYNTFRKFGHIRMKLRRSRAHSQDNIVEYPWPFKKKPITVSGIRETENEKTMTQEEDLPITFHIPEEGEALLHSGSTDIATEEFANRANCNVLLVWSKKLKGEKISLI